MELAKGPMVCGKFAWKLAELAVLNSHYRGTKRLDSVNVCSVEGNSADIFVTEVSPGILVVKRK